MRKLWIVLLILIFISTTTAIAGPPQSKGVNPNNLRSTNALTDNYVPSYDATTKKFTWVVNGAGGTAADIDLTADGDFNDYDIHAVDGLYGIDDDVYIDMGTNGYLDLGADTGIRLYGDVTIPNGGKLTMWDTGDDFSVYMSVTNDSTWLHLTGQLNVSANIMVGSTLVPDSAGGATIGTDDLEWAGLSLHNGAVISGQADQSNTITSSAAGWTFNLFPITPSAAPDADYEVANKKYVDENPGTPTNITPVDAADEDATFYPILVDGATGTQATETDAGITYNPSTNTLTTTTFTGALAGNASTATILATARTIGGVSFNGSANIDPNRGTEGVTEVATVDQDATPDVSNGTAKIHRLFKSANTVTGLVTITNFDDGAGDPFDDFNDGDWFVYRVKDQYTKIDFSTGTYIQGNAGQDWTGSAADFVDLLFRLYKTSATVGVWMCQNLNSGFSNPTTLAIDKAQFDYNIANPQSLTNYDTDDTSYTVGTEILSSVILVDGINDGDGDSIHLQDASAGYDGMLLTIHSYTDIDINDTFTIDVETDSTCVGCPMGGIFTMYNTRAVLSLRWDQGVGWQFVNYYHPVTDFVSLTAYDGTIDGISATEINFQIINQTCLVNFRIDGDKNGEANFIQFTVPVTTKNSTYNYPTGAVRKSEGGTGQTDPALAIMSPDTNIVKIYTDFAGSDSSVWATDTALILNGSIYFPIK